MSFPCTENANENPALTQQIICKTNNELTRNLADNMAVMCKLFLRQRVYNVLEISQCTGWKYCLTF